MLVGHVSPERTSVAPPIPLLLVTLTTIVSRVVVTATESSVFLSSVLTACPCCPVAHPATAAINSTMATCLISSSKKRWMDLIALLFTCFDKSFCMISLFERNAKRQTPAVHGCHLYGPAPCSAPSLPQCPNVTVPLDQFVLREECGILFPSRGRNNLVSRVTVKWLW
jgi:hypothetical protein